MKHDRPTYDELIQDLDFALSHVEGQFVRNRAMTERSRRHDMEDIEAEMANAALGFTLHNLYNAIENYFLRIAKFFENATGGDTWHRDLVNRMAFEIEGVRPALLSRDQLEPFHELRAFRHVFRILYDSALDPRRVQIANEYAEPAVELLRSAHAAYIDKLRAIRDTL